MKKRWTMRRALLVLWLVDLKVEQQIERPQLTITPKRELMAQYGITLPEFEEYVNVMLGGEAVSQVYDNGKTFDLTVKTSSRLAAESALIYPQIKAKSRSPAS